MRAVALLLLAPYCVWLVFAYEYHFVDGANLLFHEAGHVFFGLLGETIGFLGGTLGQFVFPSAAILRFLIEGKRFEAAVCGIWFGENWMYVGIYMADARSMSMPIVGGGIHDWNWLFARWGLLDRCEAIGQIAHVLGSLIVVASLAAASLASDARVRRAANTGG